jgi:hypothetical protein
VDVPLVSGATLLVAALLAAVALLAYALLEYAWRRELNKDRAYRNPVGRKQSLDGCGQRDRFSGCNTLSFVGERKPTAAFDHNEQGIIR